MPRSLEVHWLGRVSYADGVGLQKRLVEQVHGYAKLVDLHADLFAQLYSALLGERVAFDGPTEKWIVWPAAGEERDVKEAALQAEGAGEYVVLNPGGGWASKVWPAEFFGAVAEGLRAMRRASAGS